MKFRVYEESQLRFFPIYACTADINYLQEKIKRPVGLANHQLFIVSNGCGILKINGNSHTLTTNDMFFISADTPHEYYGTTPDFRTSFLSFTGNGFNSIKQYYKLSDYGVYPNKNTELFAENLRLVLEKIDSVPEISTLCAMAYYTVIVFFDEVFKKEYLPIEQVYNYIESNYSEMITLDDILTFYPHSKSKLCHDFKKKYELTIFDALIRIRLRNAHHMLKNNPYIKLTEIVKTCGFNDVSYFCKMYKRYYGETPKLKTQMKVE